MVELRTLTLLRIGQILAYYKLESQNRICRNQQPKAIFRGRALSVCRKPELIRIGIYKLIFRGLKMTEVTLIGQSHHKNSYAALNDFMFLAVSPVYYSGSNEPSLALPVQNVRTVP